MKNKLKIFTVAGSLLVCMVSAPRAELSKNERFIFNLPQNWELGYEDKADDMELKEYVPKGETVNNWDNMITVQIAYGGLQKPPAVFAEHLKQLWMQACPGAEASPVIDEVDKGYKTVFWKLTCYKNPHTNKPEVTFFRAIEGKDNFYIIQKA